MIIMMRRIQQSLLVFGVIWLELLLWSTTALSPLQQQLLLPSPRTMRHLIASPSSSLSSSSSSLGAAAQRRKELAVVEDEVAALLEEEETPAGVVGAEFFGGNKQKVELFDPVAEEQAEMVRTESLIYNRLQDLTVFPDVMAKAVAESLQEQLNDLLYYQPQQQQKEEEEKETTNGSSSISNNGQLPLQYRYAPNMVWESPLRKGHTSSPLEQLRMSLNFYRRLDVAIISAKSIISSSGSGGSSTTGSTSTSTVQVRWELSVAWPIFWEPRVKLTGISTVSLEETTITRQVDQLDQSDVFTSIASQLCPRFWDTYHIGMTPSAELLSKAPVVKKKKQLPNNNVLFSFASSLSLSSSYYKCYEIMPRLVYQPTLLDTTNRREDANAQLIPNHAFCTYIKTMGPKRQRYTPTSPIEVQFNRIVVNNNNNNNNTTTGDTQIIWNIPIAVDLLTNSMLPLAAREENDESPQEQKGNNVRYVFQPKRKVATVAYGGSPQDLEVAQVRKKLYESVIKNGLIPKLDEQGRPQFFFLQNDAKACYTQDGLGMGVYDWRPNFAKANEVGIELQADEGLAIT